MVCGFVIIAKRDEQSTQYKKNSNANMKLTYETVNEVTKALRRKGIGVMKINQVCSNGPDPRKGRKIERWFFSIHGW